MFAFCSTRQFKSRFLYCFSIYINSNATIVSVHSNVTNTVNTRFKLNLRSNKSSTPALRDVTSPLFWPGALFEHTESFQDRKRAACSRPTGRMEHVFIWGKSFRWYIKHQSKVSFPLTFLVLSPSKGHVLYTGLTCTHGTRRKINRGNLNINQTCLLFEWRGYCGSSASARPVCCGANVFRLWVHGWKANWEATTKQGYSIKLL